jgi:hypothetical protein
MGSRLTIPAAESRGLFGEWLLEFIVDGRSFRYATRAVEVDGLVFSGGLSPFSRSLSRATDQQGIEVFDPSVHWPGLDVHDAECRLWWWYPGQTLDTALHVMTGLAESVEHSDPRSPGVLVFTLNSALRPRLYPPASWTLDEHTWTVNDGVDTFTPTVGYSSIGAVPPTVIGYPGAGDKPDRSYPWPAVPVPLVDCDHTQGPGNSKLLLSPGPIDARLVWVTDADEPTNGSEWLYVERASDLLGQSFSNAYFHSPTRIDPDTGATIAMPYVLVPRPDHKYYAGFSPTGPEAGWGGGVFYGAGVLRGLGDVLTWALDQADVNGALDAMQGEAERLNEYKLDTYLDQPGLDLVRWIETALVPLFPLRRIRLGAGLWYRHENWLATRTDVVARLDTETGAVARISPVRRLRGPVQNKVTLRYKRDPVSGGYRATRTLDSVAEPRPKLGKRPTRAESMAYYQSTLEDARVTGAPNVTASQARFGVLEGQDIETPLLWSDSTVAQLLQVIAARDAFPLDGVSYQGLQLDRLLPADVVELNDPEAGLVDRLAIVDDIIVGGPVVEVDVVLLPQVRRP